MSATTFPLFVCRGRGEPPAPLHPTISVVRLAGCPSCDGSGWFLINPFATGGSNGLGGLGNLTQCLTCLDAQIYWNEHGRLPEELVAPVAKAMGLTLEAARNLRESEVDVNQNSSRLEVGDYTPSRDGGAT